MKKFRLSILLMLLVTAMVPLASASISQAVSPKPSAIVDLQILNVSDWHGQIDPLNVTNVGDVGGASVLSTYWKQERAANPNSLTLMAGDDFGATPPLANFFEEKPAVIAQRMMGVQIGTFGNHNFDRGVGHLQQMIELAGKPTSLLTPTSAYTDGLPYQYVAANLTGVTGTLTGVLPYKITDVGGVKVAVIGLVNEEAPELVKPGNFGPIMITDSIAAANQARAQAAADGAQVFVAITHKGITAPNQGPLVDFANGVKGFDLILGDHTDLQYTNRITDTATGQVTLVTENKSKGVTYLRINLQYDTNLNKVVTSNATRVQPLVSSVTKDPAIETMLKPYRDQIKVTLDQTIGIATGKFPRNGTIERIQEAAIGNLTSDAMRFTYGTQIAFTNGGGLRTPLPSSYAPQNTNLRRDTVGYQPGPPYDLVAGDVYALLPFGNVVVTRDVTGGQLWRMLENSVSSLPGVNGRFGQISGFNFSFDASRPVGSRVLAVNLNNGTAVLSDTTTYSLATNDFVNAGSEGYTMLKEGNQGVSRAVMADVVLDYIKAQGVITPTIDNRINNAPKFSPIANITLPVSGTTQPITFTVSDVEMPAASLVLTYTSSNTALVPLDGIIMEGTGITRTLKITPTPGKFGTSRISLKVFDGRYERVMTFEVVVGERRWLPLILR